MTLNRNSRTQRMAWIILSLTLAWQAAAAQKPEELVASSEIEGRRVILPSDLKMDLDWYAPVVGAEAGQIVRGWVKDDLILLETDKKNIICVGREDGTERWRCVLDESPRYEPAVSRNNVVFNVKNFLVGLEKKSGAIRWRLLPNFVMSNAPLVVDPAVYPSSYTKNWQNMESVYAGSWDGRFHAMTIRGRMSFYVKGMDAESSLAAPEFDIAYPWHKNNFSRGIITTPARLMDETIYYTADDKNVYAVTRDSEAREPYMLQGVPCTNLTVNAANAYIGSRDFYLYAIDRLTLRKKWVYPIGSPASGTVYADEPGESTYVYVPTEKDGVHTLKVRSAQGGGRARGANAPTLLIPESFEFAWKMENAAGVIGASERRVYIGFGAQTGFRAYHEVEAVDKDSGKTAWRSNSPGVRFYLEFHNAWKNTDQPLRLYAVTQDNRIVSFKEKSIDAGPLVEKPVAPPEAPKLPKKAAGQPLANPQEKPANPDEKPAKADEKK